MATLPELTTYTDEFGRTFPAVYVSEDITISGAFFYQRRGLFGLRICRKR